MEKLTRQPSGIRFRIMTNMIDYVLSINTFEQQCFVLKCMLQ